VTQDGKAVVYFHIHLHIISLPPMILDKIFTGKIRVQLLTKLLLNPSSTVYLRGLERDLEVSSNTVRLELNKLSEMQLIQEHSETNNTKTKYYKVNVNHPMFKSLRGVILQYVGLDQIIENVLEKLGNVDEVYLTGDLALGKNNPFVDLVIVGDIDKGYLYQLIEKAEKLIDKKIRVGVYQPHEFTEKKLIDVGTFMKLMG
jgi:predicted nucleotidyltransferase